MIIITAIIVYYYTNNNTEQFHKMNNKMINKIKLNKI